MKKFGLIFTALALCLAFSSCNNGKETKASVKEDSETVISDKLVADSEKENNGEVAEEDIPDTIPENSENPKEDTDESGASQEKEEKLGYINKLTGLPAEEKFSTIRPVAIMINNLKVALPQQGISQADIMYEVLAEGGITRLLCLFTDYESLPETGSVRSARDYYIDLSDAHDAIYVHCGTSPQATEVLTARKTDHMDGIYFDIPFYRDSERWNTMGKEHSLMTTGKGLSDGIAYKGFRTESDADQPLKFNSSDTNLSSGKSANKSSLEFSYYQTIELEYDENAGVYLKKQYGNPHMDSNTDTQLTFENAIFLYCEQGAIKGDEAGRLYVNFYGNGNGYYISNGEYKNIKWEKASRTSTYTLYEEDGTTELLLNPGKTYIAIAPLNAKTVIE